MTLTRRGNSSQRMLNMAAAWLVHLYTALGAILAAVMAVLIVQGDAESLRWAFIWMLAATVIDSTDGFFARKFDVRNVLPGFDGRRLDDIIDFHTYTTLPLLLIWRADILPADYAPVLLLPLLASAYGFAQTQAKTEDGYFVGFPSYWNVVAFYLFYLEPPLWVSLGLLIGCAVLTFIPAKYLYPSMAGTLSLLTIVFGAIWAVLLVLVLFQTFDDPETVVLLSLIFPIYYLGASWIVTLRLWSQESRVRLI